MNYFPKKPPEAKHGQQSSPQQVRAAHQFRPAVAQSKNAAFAPIVKRPVAPPVYRPQTVPVAAPKMAGAVQMKTHPVAPPVYRPQPVPRVLQLKTINPHAHSNLTQDNHRAAAPRAYRPQPTPRVLQTKKSPTIQKETVRGPDASRYQPPASAPFQAPRARDLRSRNIIQRSSLPESEMSSSDMGSPPTPRRSSRASKPVDLQIPHLKNKDEMVGWAKSNPLSHQTNAPDYLAAIINRLAEDLKVGDQGTVAVAELSNGTLVGARLNGSVADGDMVAARDNGNCASLNGKTVVATTTKGGSNLHAEMMIWKQYGAQMVRVAANRATCPLCAMFLEEKGIKYAPVGSLPLFGWIHPENGKTYQP